MANIILMPKNNTIPAARKINPDAIASKFPNKNVDQRLFMLYPPSDAEARPDNLNIFPIKYFICPETVRTIPIKKPIPNVPVKNAPICLKRYFTSLFSYIYQKIYRKHVITAVTLPILEHTTKVKNIPANTLNIFLSLIMALY